MLTRKVQLMRAEAAVKAWARVAALLSDATQNASKEYAGACAAARQRQLQSACTDAVRGCRARSRAPLAGRGQGQRAQAQADAQAVTRGGSLHAVHCATR